MLRADMCLPHLLGGARSRAWQSYRKAGITVCCSYRTRDHRKPGRYVPTGVLALCGQQMSSGIITLPGQCMPTRTFTMPGQYVPSGTIISPGHYGPSGTFASPGHYGPSGTFASPGHYGPSRTFASPGHYGPSRTFASPGHYGPSRTVTVPASSSAKQRWYSTSPPSQGDQDSEAKGEKGGKSLASQDVRRLLALAHPERWRLSAAVGFLTISSVVTMSAPFFLGRVIDVIYSNPSGDFSNSLTTLCALLSGVFLCGAAANGARVYLMQTSGQRIVRRLRSSLFSSVLRQEVGFFDKTRTGELINRLSSDSVVIGRSVTENLSDGLRAVAQAAVGVGMMFFVSPQLATFVLSIIPPLAVVGVIYGRYLRKVSKLTQDSLAEATQLAEERISNVRTVRAFGKEMHEMKKYDSKVDYVLDLAYKEAIARAGFFGMTGLSGNLIVLAVLYKGGLLTGAAQMSVGELSSFLMYAFWVGISIGGLSSFYSELMKGFGAGTRIWQLLDRKPEMAFNEGEMITPEKFRGALEFRNVTFMYPSRPEAPIFQGLDLSIPSGSVMAVVGPSGSGKSTLVSLLLRLYDPNSGSVHIDGHDVRHLNPLWLRSKIGTVSQEPVLFSCSISENIAYGAEDPSSVTQEQIRRVADIANALNFVENFPRGFDTVVGEKGVLLSGGQKQRIAIARALLKDPRILLLDEATSALDAENEFLVQEALDRLMEGRTVLIIAHRLSTIQNADAVAVIDQGRVVECGKHEQLLKNRDGLFSKLMDKQASLLRSRDAILTAQ